MKKNSKKDQQKNSQKSEKVLSSLVGSLEEMETALDGDATDIETVAEAPSTAPAEYAMPMIKKRKTMFVVGILVILMTVVGVKSTITSSIDIANDFFNQTSLKNEFAEFVYPLVISDTPTFESTADIPSSVIITASVWNILLNYDTSKYPVDTGVMTVSEIDVENSAAALFGSGINVQHQTVGSIATMFEYNETEKSYYIPENPIVVTYTPRVSSIKCDGELYTIAVEYMPPSMFTFDKTHEEEPDKTVIYTILRDKTSMSIQSVLYGDEKVVN